jgi:NADH-quinone oxidoreductase subunit A
MVIPTLVWPLLVYFAGVLILVGGILGVSYVLGEHHKDHVTGEPYESGVVSTGSARVRFDAKFYLVAMFFVIFDLESMFILAWAVAVREVSWPGYIAMLIFIATLLAALIYLWKQGALDWGSKRTRRLAGTQEAQQPLNTPEK